MTAAEPLSNSRQEQLLSNRSTAQCERQVPEAQPTLSSSGWSVSWRLRMQVA